MNPKQVIVEKCMMMYSNGRCLSEGGVLRVRDPWRLLEPHERVHAEFSGLKHSRAADGVYQQTRGSVRAGGLHGHHEPVPGALQQSSQTAGAAGQRRALKPALRFTGTQRKQTDVRNYSLF